MSPQEIQTIREVLEVVVDWLARGYLVTAVVNLRSLADYIERRSNNDPNASDSLIPEMTVRSMKIPH